MSPSRPLRHCAHQGCAALVPYGRCLAHGGTIGSPDKPWARPSAFAPLRTRGRAWTAIRAEVLAEEAHCAICAQLGQPDDVVDHWVALSQGGTDDRMNLRRVHRRCHAMKTGRESTRARLGGGR